MNTLPTWTFFLAIAVAAALEVTANILLTKSEGLKKVSYGVRAFALVGLAFTCLAYAVRGMDLAVAYALWGGVGILGTSICGWLIFGQRLKGTAWLGICLLIGGMAVLHLW